jgi:hypothetical protein
MAEPVVKVALGANGVWLNGPATEFTKDFEAGPIVSASLSPHISAVAHAFYGLSGNYIRYDGGARVTATDVENPNFNLYLGILYRNGSTAAVRPGEWAPDAGVGWKPNPKAWPNIILGADAAYGLESQRIVSYAAVRWQFGRAGK